MQVLVTIIVDAAARGWVALGLIGRVQMPLEAGAALIAVVTFAGIWPASGHPSSFMARVARP